MTLLSLSNDIFLCIFDALDVDDIESFTAINKSTYHLAAAFLAQHRTRKKKYSRVFLGDKYEFSDDSDEPSWQGHPLNLVCEIREHPIVAQYVHYLEFTAFEKAYYDRGRKQLRELTQRRIDNCGWLKDELSKMGVEPDFGSNTNDEWNVQLLQSVADPIDTSTVFAYLLTLTTKLRHLNTCFVEQTGWCRTALKLFAHLALQQGITSPVPLFLPELDKLEVFHWNVSDDFSSELLEVCAPFLAWTGLKRLECNRLRAENPLPAQLETARPQVAEMALSKCYIDADALGGMIRHMPLRVFRYEHAEFHVFEIAARPRSLLRALKRHVGSTLEELVLVVDEGTFTIEMRTLLDFRGLRALKRLVLDVDGLFSTEEENLDGPDDGYETTEEERLQEHDALWTPEDRTQRRDETADSDDDTLEAEDEEDKDPRSVFELLLRMLPESLEGLLIKLEGLREDTYEEFAEILRNVQSTRLKNLTEFRYTLDFIGYSYELDSDPFADEMTLPTKDPDY